jgi:predicted  nucleic acid-binding Zn-ribbon protein
MSDEAESSLGDRLLLGVRNLWSEVGDQRKVLDHQGHEFEGMKRRLKALESEVHGLKSSKGRAIANNSRLKGSLAEAEDKLHKISQALN